MGLLHICMLNQFSQNTYQKAERQSFHRDAFC